MVDEPIGVHERVPRPTFGYPCEDEEAGSPLGDECLEGGLLATSVLRSRFSGELRDLPRRFWVDTQLEFIDNLARPANHLDLRAFEGLAQSLLRLPPVLPKECRRFF